MKLVSGKQRVHLPADSSNVLVLISNVTHATVPPDSDAVMKNPFYTLEMPINASGFDTKVAALVAATNG
jgi:hypothetical protein